MIPSKLYGGCNDGICYQCKPRGCSDADLGQMTSLKINVDDADQLYRFLKTNNIEVPIFSWNGQNLLRVSFQCYNSMKDISSLNKFLSKFLNGN